VRIEAENNMCLYFFQCNSNYAPELFLQSESC
jgi:hypothetical protein